MSFRRPIFTWMLAGLAGVACLPALGQQPLPRRGRPISFSEPRRDSGVASNLNEIATQKTKLRDLEEELRKPFDLFGLDDPLAGRYRQALPQLPPPNLNSKRAKELFEKKQEKENWVFQTPENQKFGLTAEEIFKFPEYETDGRVKEKRKPVEEFYDRLERERAGPTNHLKSEDLFGLDAREKGSGEPDSFNRDQTPGQTANAAPPGWKPYFGSEAVGDRVSDTGKARSLAEILTARNVESPDALRAQAARLSEFRQLLESKPLAPSANPFNPAPAKAAGNRSLPGLEPSPAATTRSAFQPLPAPLGGSLPPASMSPPAAGLSGLNPAMLPPEPARAPVHPPTLNIPKRKF